MRSVYIVDDSADYRFLLNHFIKRFLPECTVELFDGAGALLSKMSTINQQSSDEALPGLILLDLHMDDMSGYELLKILKSTGGNYDYRWREVPVVINSSDITEESVKTCTELGAKACLRKSVDVSDLYALIDFVALNIQNARSA
jgi:CheY-like chemotaxis protein